MKIKCDYCNSYINDTDEKCPHCGSNNEHLVRVADGTPRTIAELEKWYSDHNLPPYETTRFFIGINYPDKRAFGIYEENGQFIVYKNKDDGSRAIRYQGTDEAYAVNELYLKLKSEILNQKAHQSGSTQNKTSLKTKMQNTGSIIATILTLFSWTFIFEYKPFLYVCLVILPFVALIVASAIKGDALFKKMWLTFGIYAMAVTLIIGGIAFSKSGTSYYRYNDSIYCYYEYDYYEYDSSYSDYSPIDFDMLPYELRQNLAEYEFDASDIDWDYNYNITNSDYYYEHLQSTSSDSDYSWDSGSDWDSGSTDWGSDW